MLTCWCALVLLIIAPLGNCVKNNKQDDPHEHTLADWFIPFYGDVIETFPNGEKIVTKYLYFPPGFWLFFIVIMLSLIKTLW